MSPRERVASPCKPRRRRKATPKKHAGKKAASPREARISLGSSETGVLSAMRRMSLTPATDVEMVTALWLCSSYLDAKTLLTVLPLVSKATHALCDKLAWTAALVGACADEPAGMVELWPELCASFPWGEHLAEGGYKSVYRVWNAASARLEAISVMEVSEPEDREIMVQEMLGSYLLHDLLQRGVCPNFVNTRQVFRCPHPAPHALWGDEENPTPSGAFDNFETEDLSDFKPPRRPSAKSTAGSSWIFLRMELCEGGDIESHLKRLPDNALGEVSKPLNR